MHVPKCVPLDFMQSIANMQTPLSPLFRTAQGKFLIFLAAWTEEKMIKEQMKSFQPSENIKKQQKFAIISTWYAAVNSHPWPL